MMQAEMLAQLVCHQTIAGRVTWLGANGVYNQQLGLTYMHFVRTKVATLHNNISHRNIVLV